MNVLDDQVFLKRLNEQKVQHIYTKIFVLNNDEYPVAEIQGRITQGSESIDGKSSMRRTANLTFIVDKPEDSQLDDLDNLLSLNKKIQIYIGQENHVDEKYDDIIWHKQGIFYIVNASITHNTTSINISLSLKDKMSKLNGDLGGVFPAPTTLSSYEIVDEFGNVTKESQRFYDIIKTIVSWYGGEDDSRILVNDVDLQIKQIMRYLGEDNFFVKTENGKVTEVSLDFMDAFTQGRELKNKVSVAKNIDNEFLSLVIGEDMNPAAFTTKDSSRENSKVFIVIKDSPYDRKYITRESTEYNKYKLKIGCDITFDKVLEYNDLDPEWDYFLPGDEVGYTYVDFIWPQDSDLIINAGESVTSALDKVIGQLGNYEYFYDVDGNFIFQEKKNYLNNRCLDADDNYLLESRNKSSEVVYPENQLCGINSHNYMADYNGNAQTAYDFLEGDSLITSYSNTLDYTSIKNDFHVWGKSSKDNSSYDLHYHLAIREKPKLHEHKYAVIFGRDSETGEPIDTIKLYNTTTARYCLIGRINTEDFNKDNSSEEINSFTITINKSKNVYEKYTCEKGWIKEEDRDKIYTVHVDEDGIACLVGCLTEDGAFLLDSNIWQVYNNTGFAAIKGTDLIYYMDVSFSVYVKEEGYVLEPTDTTNPIITEEVNEGNKVTILSLSSVEITDDYFLEMSPVGILKLDPKDTVYGPDENGLVSLTMCYGVTDSTLKVLSGIWYKDFDAEYEAEDWRMELLLQGLSKSAAGMRPDVYEQELIDKFLDTYDAREKKFKADMLKNPNLLKYFLDFVSIDGKDKYRTENIGIRINSKLYDGIRRIFNLDIPNIVYLNVDYQSEDYDTYRRLCQESGQDYLDISEDVFDLLSIGANSESAIETARNLLYEYTEFNDTINIQSVPIYYLEPNTRISVFDQKSNIDGDYIISSITPSFGSGAMTIQATKAVEKF